MRSSPRQWDVFCRVVDNFGDVGVARRLAGDLASRGGRVRLRIDDASALAWMAPGGTPGVELLGWDDDDGGDGPGDVVVETFGCGLPQRFLDRMAALDAPPAWIDVEHLSAEDYVERSHRLPSPVKAAGDRWLTRHFFFPGFTPRTGGLLREPGLAAARDDFDRDAWLAAQGIEALPGERLASLFCYADAPLPALLDRLGDAPTLLLAAPGPAASRLTSLLGPALRRGALRARLLPWLPQTGYDRLLWSCDLNFVRGEDSFVRAQWAGVPFVWQAYAQQDGVHAAKLESFLGRLLADADADAAADAAAAGVAVPLRRLWLAWNGVAGPGTELPPLPPLPGWNALMRRWRRHLEAQADLTTQLIAFVDSLRPTGEPDRPNPV